MREHRAGYRERKSSAQREPLITERARDSDVVSPIRTKRRRIYHLDGVVRYADRKGNVIGGQSSRHVNQTFCQAERERI